MERVSFDDITAVAHYRNNQIALIENLRDVERAAAQENSYMVDGFIFAIIVKGNAEIILDDQRYRMTAGDTFACKPRNLLETCMISMDNDIRCLFISPEYVERLARTLNIDWTFLTMIQQHEIIHMEPAEVEQAILALRLLGEKLNAPDSPNKQSAIDALLAFLAYSLFDIRHRIHGDTIPRAQFTSAEAIFSRFVSLLNDPEVPFLSVAEYAERLHITPKYFSSVCKVVSGKSANTIITEEIMRMAQLLLKDNRKSIKQIADDLNFKNQSHFGSFFRRHMGISPQHFRENYFCTDGVKD